LEPIANESLDQYLTQLRIKWQQELSAISPKVADYFADEEVGYPFRMRYQGNMLRVGLHDKKKLIEESHR
jgi:hypothetical protein